MLIISANRQVVSWNWPWEGDSDLVAASKALDKSKLEKLDKAATEFAATIRDLISSTSHETGGATLTEESAQEGLKEFKARISRFENVANPILSNAVVLHEELRSRGISAPFKVEDAVRGKMVGMDEMYTSLFDTADQAEKAWGEDAFRRIYLSIIAGRMMALKKGISEWASTFADPEFIQRADRASPIDIPDDVDLDEERTEPPATQETKTTGPVQEQEKPSAQPETRQRLKIEPRDPNAPYFAGTGNEKDDWGDPKGHHGKGKAKLLSDILDVLRINKDKLPDDLKAPRAWSKLIGLFNERSRLKTAGLLERVYMQRKVDVHRVIQQWVKDVGGDSNGVIDFETSVLKDLEEIWNAEDFQEVEPSSVKDVISAFRDMTDRGEDRGKILSTLSGMLMKLSGGDEAELNKMSAESPTLFKSGPLAEALKNVRETIRSSRSVSPRNPPGSGLPKPQPSAPIAPSPIAPKTVQVEQAPTQSPQPMQPQPESASHDDPFAVPSGLPKANQGNPQQEAPKRKLRRPGVAIKPTTTVP